MSLRTSQLLSRTLWAVVLLTLPVTSFRYFPFFGSGTVVRPLALYPLGILLLSLFYQALRGQILFKLPPNYQLLLLFTSLIIFTGLLGETTPYAEGVGISYGDRFLRALLTLLIGLAFYFCAAVMNRSAEQVKFSLIWLTGGLILSIIWGTIQFYGLNHGIRGELLEIQNLFSVRGLVKNKRVSGFAYEPSWLANQLNTIYFPWIIGALAAGIPMINIRSIFDRIGKYGWTIINLFLLIGASTLMLFTYSRSGLAVLLASLLVTITLTGRQTLKHSIVWFFSAAKGKRINNFLVRIGILFLIFGGVAGVAIFLNDKGYISAFFQKNSENFFEYIQKAYLGPRFAYLTAALSAALAHPFTGVGLGASGFWILENMPDWALSGNLEIAKLLSPSTNIFPNPKNLFMRVLAETGFFGFILLVLFFLNLLGMALYLLQSNREITNDRWTLLVGVAGVFGVTAVFLSGFSQDSFAMPELWITPGILAGYYQSHQYQKRGQAE